MRNPRGRHNSLPSSSLRRRCPSVHCTPEYCRWSSYSPLRAHGLGCARSMWDCLCCSSFYAMEDSQNLAAATLLYVQLVLCAGALYIIVKAMGNAYSDHLEQMTAEEMANSEEEQNEQMPSEPFADRPYFFDKNYVVRRARRAAAKPHATSRASNPILRKAHSKSPPGASGSSLGALSLVTKKFMSAVKQFRSALVQGCLICALQLYKVSLVTRYNFSDCIVYSCCSRRSVYYYAATMDIRAAASMVYYGCVQLNAPRKKGNLTRISDLFYRYLRKACNGVTKAAQFATTSAHAMNQALYCWADSEALVRARCYGARLFYRFQRLASGVMHYWLTTVAQTTIKLTLAVSLATKASNALCTSTALTADILFRSFAWICVHFQSTRIAIALAQVGTIVAHCCYGACFKRQGYESDSSLYSYRDIQDNLGGEFATLELHSAHHCRHCASRQSERIKKPTVSAYFRAELAHLIETRLNPRAAPFSGSFHFRAMIAHVLMTRLNPRASTFIPRVRRGKWHYLVDPATKHLRLPGEYSSTQNCTRIKTMRFKTKTTTTTNSSTLSTLTTPTASDARNAPKTPNPRKAFPTTDAQNAPTTPVARSVPSSHDARTTYTTPDARNVRTAPTAPTSASRIKLKPVPRLSPILSKRKRLTLFIGSSGSRPLRRAHQGRHRRHRRHRKHRLRGLPTPASSLYSSPRAPPQLSREESEYPVLSDHG